MSPTFPAETRAIADRKKSSLELAAAPPLLHFLSSLPSSSSLSYSNPEQVYFLALILSVFRCSWPSLPFELPLADKERRLLNGRGDRAFSSLWHRIVHRICFQPISISLSRPEQRRQGGQKSFDVSVCGAREERGREPQQHSL